MKRIATFSMIVALSALSHGGIAYAQAEMNWPANIGE